MTQVSGTVHPRFAPVRDELVRLFAAGHEQGASLAVWQRGELVVDLWGGVADEAGLRPFGADALVTMFSATKGMVALCFSMLVDRGLLDDEAPVSRWWPAFEALDKAPITVRMLLEHRSGLIGVDEPITLDMLERDPAAVAGVLERARPRWFPGAAQGYHAVTYGLYAGELFRRITAESVGTFFRREVAEPLGAEVFLGLPEALEPRVAPIRPLTPRQRLTVGLPDILLGGGAELRILRGVLAKGDPFTAFAQPEELGASHVANFNLPRVHRLELPWGGALGTARGLARIYAALANGGALDGVKLLSDKRLSVLKERGSFSERDRVLQRPMGWTRGFVKEEPGVFGTTRSGFGHPGAGGALGWCEPERALAIAYLPTKMAHHVRSPRALTLCRAIAACAG
jgi:CubicO group peptidase (beta-lactamase class C family)